MLCIRAKIPQGQALDLPAHHQVPSLEPGTQLVRDKWHTMIEEKCIKDVYVLVSGDAQPVNFSKNFFLYWVASLVAQMVKNLPAM